MHLERHPLSKLWPDMPEAQFAELKTDIEKRGQRYPIIVYGGKIIDGWHRFRACVDLEIKPKIERFSGTAQGAVELVNSLNAHRRNVSESQRAFAVTGSYQWIDGQSGGVARATPDTKTNQEMASLSGTSQDTIIRAKKVHEAGSKALKEAVQAGEVSVKKAATVVDLPKKEQLAAAKSKPEKSDPEFKEHYEFNEKDDEVIAIAEREYQASVDKVMDSDNHLVKANEEIKRLTGLVAVLTRTRDQYMTSYGEAVKMVKRLQRENDRLKKADRSRPNGHAAVM